MNLQQLHFVIAVAKTNSFSEAAKKCHVTQPTLSNAIAKLEKELGGNLFERSTRKVSLSGLGIHLLPIIESITSSQRELTDATKAYQNPTHKLLRIGLSPLVNAQIISLVTEPFLLRNPEVQLFFKECAIDDMYERLQSQQVDLIIRPKPMQKLQQRNLKQIVLYEDELTYLPQQENAQQSDSVDLAQIKDDIFILSSGTCGLRDITLSMFESRGLKLNQYSGQAMGYEVLLEWAELGIGSAILPRSKVSTQYSKKVSTILLENQLPAKVEFSAIWVKNENTPKHIQQFHQYISKNADRLVCGLTQ